MKNKFIGYDGVDLGVTNQKIAFIGLAYKAMREGCSLSLPPFVIYDGNFPLVRVDFSKIFEIDRMKSVLESFLVSPIQEHNRIDEIVEGGGWQMFLEGADRIGEVRILGDVALDDLTCQIARAFIPKCSIKKISDEINHSMRGFGVNCAIQMRIENDWESYSHQCLSSFQREKNLPTASEIIYKSKKHLGSKFSQAYVLCDEKMLPSSKEKIREIVLKEHGVSLFWKSDFIDIDKYDALTLSLIDFQIAKSMDLFIGTSRSTFSCFVSFEKYAESRKLVRNHYIYNGASGEIEERFDNGTSVDPNLSVDKTYERPDLIKKTDKDVLYPMTLHAHVSNIGEYFSKNNVIRGVISGNLVVGDRTKGNFHRIEGFSISSSEDAPKFLYRSQNFSGFDSGWVDNNRFCGTKGLYSPIKSFAIKLSGPCALELDCIYAGVFSDRDEVIISSNGEFCTSVTGNGSLLCMQILVRRKNY